MIRTGAVDRAVRRPGALWDGPGLFLGVGDPDVSMAHAEDLWLKAATMELGCPILRDQPNPIAGVG